MTDNKKTGLEGFQVLFALLALVMAAPGLSWYNPSETQQVGSAIGLAGCAMCVALAIISFFITWSHVRVLHGFTALLWLVGFVILAAGAGMVANTQGDASCVDEYTYVVCAPVTDARQWQLSCAASAFAAVECLFFLGAYRRLGYASVKVGGQQSTAERV